MRLGKSLTFTQGSTVHVYVVVNDALKFLMIPDFIPVKLCSVVAVEGFLLVYDIDIFMTLI